MGFRGGTFTCFFEAVMAKADPRWFWMNAFWTCLGISVVSVIATVWGYLHLEGERRTFTYTLHLLDLSSNPVEHAAAIVASFALVVYPLVLVALIVDLRTCVTVCLPGEGGSVSAR